VSSVSADLAVSGPGAPADAWVRAWGVALGELEVAVEEAAAMLHHLPLPADVNVTRWAPPSGLGPLPASLETRARALLDRHVEVTRQTAEAIVQTKRHLHAVGAMRSSGPAVPVYIDTCA
jgi:hypothetical protein